MLKIEDAISMFDSNDLIGKYYTQKIENIQDTWKVVDVIEEDGEVSVVLKGSKGLYKAIQKKIE